MFGRLGILGVVAALVVSLVVLVPPGAAEAADPGVLDVTDFVVLGVDGVYLKQNASVTSGDVGAVNATSGPYLAGSQETTIGLAVTVLAGSRVFGNSVKLKQGSTVGDVYTNDLSGNGTVTGSVFTPVLFPLDVALPAVPVAQPGVTYFDVAQGGSLTLDAGSYGLLKARNDATVTLTGGVYEFSEWDIRDRVTVEVLAPSQIVVAGRVATGKNSALMPGPGVEPFEVKLTVLGVNGNTGKVGATPKAAKFGIGSTVSAVVWVPNGTAWLRQNAQGQGQFLGRWVTVGIGVTVERSVDVGLPLPSTVDLVSPVDADLVFDTETVTATIDTGSGADTADLLIDGTLVDSQPIVEGSMTFLWDTTSAADGLATVAVVAYEAGVEVASTSISVTVNNALTSGERLDTDFDQGALGLDDYSFHVATALTVPDVLPERYRGAAEDAEAGFAWMMLADTWNLLDSATQQHLTDLLTAVDSLEEEVARGVVRNYQEGGSPGGGPQPMAQAQQAAGPPAFPIEDWDGCIFVNELAGVGFELWRVRCSQDYGATDVRYELAGGTGGLIDNPNGVAMEDGLGRNGTDVNASYCNGIGSCNGVPDYIDWMIASLEHARSEYVQAGFLVPGGPTRTNVRAGRAQALPPSLPTGGSIYLDRSRDEFDTARHEVFHLATYEYASLTDYRTRDGWWWGEASAEWATHTFRPSWVPREESEYHAQLPAFLGRPNSRITLLEETHWTARSFAGAKNAPFLDGARRRSQYGAFVLADWLEVYTDDPTVVRRTWEELGQPDSRGALESVRDAVGEPIGDVILQFHIGSYLLEHSGTDVDPETVLWRSRLNGGTYLPGPLLGEYSTVADAFGAARPARITQPVLVDAVTAAPTSTLRSLEPGGVAYVEVDLPSGGGGLTITAPSNPSLRYAMVAFDATGYPELCSTPSELVMVDAGGGFDEAVYVYDASCESATMIVSWSDALEAGGPYEADWTVSHSSIAPVSLINPGFETGDLTGWTPFQEVPDPYTVFEVTTQSVRSGTYGANLYTTANPTEGFEQLVSVAPGVEYYGGAWVNNYASLADMGIRIVDASDRSIIGEATRIGGGYSGLTFVAPPSGSIYFQLVYVGMFGDTPGGVFDDAVLIEAGVTDGIVNGGFEDFVPFAGWRTTSLSQYYEIVADPRPFSPGNLAAQLTVDNLLFIPVAIEQGPFSAYETEEISLRARVTEGTTASVTIEAIRLDGSIAATSTTTITTAESFPQANYALFTEDVLTLRISVSGPQGTKVLIDGVDAYRTST